MQGAPIVLLIVLRPFMISSPGMSSGAPLELTQNKAVAGFKIDKVNDKAKVSKGTAEAGMGGLCCDQLMCLGCLATARQERILSSR